MVATERVKFAEVEGADELFTPAFNEYLVALHDRFADKVSDLRAERAIVLRRALEQGDELVKQELKREARYLGLGVANLVNLLSPQMVVLGGGVVEALGERLLKGVRKHARKYALDHAMQNVEIVPAALGDDAVILGCAALAQVRRECGWSSGNCPEGQAIGVWQNPVVRRGLAHRDSPLPFPIHGLNSPSHPTS